MKPRSYVVTGGGRGIGRGICEHILGVSENSHVVAFDLDAEALRWTEEHGARGRLTLFVGDASDVRAAERAADLAGSAGPLSGWVNNSALFRDASLHGDGSGAVIEAIGSNLHPVVVGCSVAVRAFLRDNSGGAIVNVSSHQAQRAVRGALPYATQRPR